MKDYFKIIEDLKKEKNAIILAHVYQRDEIQGIADFTGDSLELSRKAVNTNAKVIVFCGVRFMAETAAILNPDKTVLLPEINAGCELADMAPVEELRRIKSDYPNATVVSYVNSSADIKAESDICCTSANAVKVVNSLHQEQILFVPDRNLGSYVAEMTNKNIIPWDGYCYVHEENISEDEIRVVKKKHLDAIIMVHPECSKPVRDLADFIGSTSQMLRYAKDIEKKEFIVGTEDGLLYRLQKENPDKKFYALGTICNSMKMIDLEKLTSALEKMQYSIMIPEEIRIKAKNALDKMLKV